MNEDFRFNYYVLNENFNKHEIEYFNVFNNCIVNQRTLKAVKKYLHSPSKFEYTSWLLHKTFYGFDGFVRELDTIIKGEEWSRCEYEIMVNGLFSDEDKAEKWDCYMQCKPNMEMIAREVIYQYKQYLKEKKEK